MSDLAMKNLLVVLGAALLVALLLLMRPEYLADYSILGALLFAQILFVTLLKYRQAFFPTLLLAFVCAGTDMPGHGAFLTGRWVVLAAGALCGIPIYMRVRMQSFNLFHLIAAFCVLSAIVSAFVSDYPQEAVLKALSLTLLFIYAASGGRTSVPALQPERFFRGLLIGCEVLNIFTAISYFALRWDYFGNPNSLGAVMGIAIVPMLLWGLVSSDAPMRRRRLGAGLILALLLLLTSFSRASIGAALVSSTLLCVTLRQYRLLIKGVALTVLLAVVAVLLIPEPVEGPEFKSSDPISAIFLYKGHEDGGVFASRRTAWTQTWDVIKRNPWFGSGYGTSFVTDDMTKMSFAKKHIDSWVIREHGNSYLAIMEWAGLLGVLPFYALVLLAARNARMVFARARRTGDALMPALPAAAIISAGLIHAAFEDWMFAVGYYMCVFFWTIAFILVDLLPRPETGSQPHLAVSLRDVRLQPAPAVSAT